MRPEQSEQVSRPETRNHCMSETLDTTAKPRPVHEPEPASARPSRIRNFDPLKPPTDQPQSYYDAIKQRFAEERDLGLVYPPDGKAQSSTALAAGANPAKYD